jgi:hypothetical protein
MLFMWTSTFNVKTDVFGGGAFFVVHIMDALGAHGLLSPTIWCLLKSEGEVGVILSGA